MGVVWCELIFVLKLVLVIECGGFDGYLGIIVNLVVGIVVDWIVVCGGIVIFGEMIEVYGVEYLLMNCFWM